MRISPTPGAGLPGWWPGTFVRAIHYTVAIAHNADTQGEERIVDSATASMIENLKTNTDRSLEEWLEVLASAPGGMTKHGEMLKYLKTEHGLTHGYANFVALRFRAGDSPPVGDGLVDSQYSGVKANLRPIYEALLGEATRLGDDVEVAPKKASVSLRRNKQFALLSPATKDRIDVGINLPGVEPTDRLKADKGMCTHKVGFKAIDEIDDELRGWLRDAYDRA